MAKFDESMDGKSFFPPLEVEDDPCDLPVIDLVRDLLTPTAAAGDGREEESD